VSKRSGAVEIKRIYDQADKADGARVLVDRIWPRGVSKDRAALTLWLKEIAPSAELRQWFGHDPERWKEFRLRYRAELQNNKESVTTLLALISKGPVTLLYAAHDSDCNNAVVLQEFIERRSKT
jgi:uncharacterized protein YeaO (DUF488 family)